MLFSKKELIEELFFAFTVINFFCQPSYLTFTLDQSAFFLPDSPEESSVSESLLFPEKTYFDQSTAGDSEDEVD